MKPKVLFITNFIRPSRRGFYEAMVDRWKVRLLFFSDGGEWYWRWPVEPVGELPGRYLPGRWFFGTRWSWSLVRELWTTDADVIVKCLGGRFALPATFIIARIRRIPFVFWFSVFQLPRHGLQRFSRPLVAYIARGSAAVVTNGPHESALVSELGVPAERISVAPLAAPAEPFLAPVTASEMEEVLGGRRRSFVMGYVGRLETWKGPDIALRALAQVVERGVDAMCLIVGDGSERLPLEELAASLGVQDRIRFLGQLPYQALPAAYRAMDVVVIPSRAGTRGHTEDWSTVANEGMLSGTVVLASVAVGAVRGGLVEDHVTGRVFPEGDVDTLADIVFELARDGAQRDTLKRAASVRISDYTYAAALNGFDVGVHLALAANVSGGAR